MCNYRGNYVRSLRWWRKGGKGIRRMLIRGWVKVTQPAKHRRWCTAAIPELGWGNGIAEAREFCRQIPQEENNDNNGEEVEEETEEYIYIGHLHKTNKSRTKERDLSSTIFQTIDQVKTRFWTRNVDKKRRGGDVDQVLVLVIYIHLSSL